MCVCVCVDQADSTLLWCLDSLHESANISNLILALLILQGACRRSIPVPCWSHFIILALHRLRSLTYSPHFNVPTKCFSVDQVCRLPAACLRRPVSFPAFVLLSATFLTLISCVCLLVHCLAVKPQVHLNSRLRSTVICQQVSQLLLLTAVALKSHVNQLRF